MKLELFKFDTCPYCIKVFKEIESQGRSDIEFLDIRKSEDARQRLIKEGGKEQVPCLFIDGSPLYESSDIVDWLRANRETA